MSDQKRSAFDALSPPHQAAVLAWCSGANHTEAAAACNVHRSQTSRWWKRTDVQAAVRELRGEAWSRRRLRLEAHSDSAVETLGKLLHNEEVTPETRLRAAEITLRLAGHTTRGTAEDAAGALDDAQAAARIGALLGIAPKPKAATVVPLRAVEPTEEDDAGEPGETLQ